MPRYVAALTIVLMIRMVLTRAFVMKRHGMTAFHFGQIDKKDFIIPPFALFYTYIVFAAAFGWPMPNIEEFFRSQAGPPPVENGEEADLHTKMHRGYPLDLINAFS
jgi:hypothetical protein